MLQWNNEAVQPFLRDYGTLGRGPFGLCAIQLAFCPRIASGHFDSPHGQSRRLISTSTPPRCCQACLPNLDQVLALLPPPLTTHQCSKAAPSLLLGIQGIGIRPTHHFIPSSILHYGAVLSCRPFARIPIKALTKRMDAPYTLTVIVSCTSSIGFIASTSLCVNTPSVAFASATASSSGPLFSQLSALTTRGTPPALRPTCTSSRSAQRMMFISPCRTVPSNQVLGLAQLTASRPLPLLAMSSRFEGSVHPAPPAAVPSTPRPLTIRLSCAASLPQGPLEPFLRAKTTPMDDYIDRNLFYKAEKLSNSLSCLTPAFSILHPFFPVVRVVIPLISVFWQVWRWISASYFHAHAPPMPIVLDGYSRLGHAGS
ncbi:hypothetical protein LshimejAT787_0905160 [Lyophyllum shimeji]|uniref:Uncharacterized protein n=1 Tax=Lyophyllum shimeji TaxID=47721 RepID=A0A9P3PT96_LYOSH|nr:hypothetical protein LshimejAT787_0905160 [Lyophyllum shimeji]